MNVVERFPMQQALDLLFVRESFDAMELVLEDAAVEIVCHSDIERSREAAHDVHVIFLLLMRHIRG